MPRRNVAFTAGEHYHVYNRGHNRQTVFFDRANYLYFLGRIREFLTPYCADVVAYCLMPNHYHLLLRLKTNELSAAMHRVSVSYAKAVNKRRQLVGSLFQGPFQAIHVDEEAYLLHLTRYIHLNPSEACLVERAEEWPYSSYPDYVGLRHGTLPQPGAILKEFEGPDRYRAFVESRAPYPAGIHRYTIAE